jgi:hypothetical protein
MPIIPKLHNDASMHRRKKVDRRIGRRYIPPGHLLSAPEARLRAPLNAKPRGILFFFARKKQRIECKPKLVERVSLVSPEEQRRTKESSIAWACVHLASRRRASACTCRRLRKGRRLAAPPPRLIIPRSSSGPSYVSQGVAANDM